MQLEEDVLDLTRDNAALTGDVLANFVNLGTVMELDARRMGFDCIDTFDHSSPQRVNFEMPSTLGSSLEGCCEKG